MKNQTISIFLHNVGNRVKRNRLVEEINEARRELNLVGLLGTGACGV